MNCHQCPSTCKHPNPKRKGWLKWFKSLTENHSQNSVQESLVQYQGPKVALVGFPNVGKSVVFNALTGSYVTVSNYPGTTVEITTGEMVMDEEKLLVVDTPGMYSLMSITEEERVTRNLLFTIPFDLIIQVVDGKNLGRMLSLTLQLLEAKLPVILAVNMIDEMEQLGLRLNIEGLEEKLGIPVIAMAAASNRGIKSLKRRVMQDVKGHHLSSAS